MSEGSQPQLTEEQVQAKVKELQAAVSSFMSDPRHERYQSCAENKAAIGAYLSSRKLECTADALHQAYEDLSKEGKLALYAESKLPPEPPKERAKDNLPPIGVANSTDLGIDFRAQQRARKESVQGVRPASGRDAFIQAAQRASQMKVGGGRFHL